MLTFLFDVATTYDPTQNKLNTTALYSPFIILLYLCNIPYYFNCSYFFYFFCSLDPVVIITLLNPALLINQCALPHVVSSGCQYASRHCSDKHR